MNALSARIVVLVSGAAILVVETLATRLVAPYVGLTLSRRRWSSASRSPATPRSSPTTTLR
ncbi:hypothetical protein ACVGVM_25955 [Pseudonocardia bannensis]|uniref:Uncharacterized protein n=1 Tax=Pseudonocardia bannensis TaxID=630973 RepID=A0A848DLV1_9PSEU|nr:hypothetical protein [Pseudonocardia bannensis]NMH93737.1 hypothetical protein [Pseudonocardia bannensis]